jgi:SAM-dependent methyltransferase
MFRVILAPCYTLFSSRASNRKACHVGVILNKCIACDHIKWELLQYPRASSPLFVGKHIRVCHSCGLGVVDSLIDESALSEYYVNIYGSVANREKFPDVSQYFEYPDRMYKVERSRSQLRLLDRYLSLHEVKDVLEIGPGLGTLCYLIKRRNRSINYSAIEFEEKAVSHMKHLGVGVFNSIPDLSDTFDLLISSHSLEHQQVHELTENIQNYWELLRVGGVMLLEVPLIDFRDNCGLQLKQAHDPHTLFFTVNALRRLFGRVGFKVEFMEPVGPLVARNRGWKICHRIHATLEKYNLFYSEYGGDRRCVRAIFRKY